MASLLTQRNSSLLKIQWSLTVTSTNVKPSSKFIDSIKHFPTPTDITGARSWFGLIGQLTVLAPSSARNTASAPVKPQIAVTMDGNCLAGSIVTTPAESRYVPIEGETLTVVHDLHQTRYYVLGCTNLTVTTEIKPLVKILSDKTLIHSGIPDQCWDLNSELRSYHKYAASIFCVNGVILMGHRIAIPASFHPILTSYGGAQFTAGKTREFLKTDICGKPIQQLRG
ncbi:hypothetical protein RRG08_063277 [Elysia crispata]|uniref:Reverse transcriptase RNase H-like domain-containing protein n=1 Tax=Elysia crispata TaxID=231223 RepID=A0AAE0XP57_9GAST|nr:hypothetical protein RRG08_063277 [Elysia crispata]